MFTGIIEAVATVRAFVPRGDVYEISIDRPLTFDDLRAGDSIAVDGVCLTVEEWNEDSIQFALGTETLQVTRAVERIKVGNQVNLERSLRFGDRVHGHLVSGHVDGLGTVLKRENEPRTGKENFLIIKILYPSGLAGMIWKKGSIAVNGVSLTVNAAEGDTLEVGLIPETLKRTNLGGLTPRALVNLEVDQFARGFLRQRELTNGKS